MNLCFEKAKVKKKTIASFKEIEIKVDQPDNSSSQLKKYKEKYKNRF